MKTTAPTQAKVDQHVTWYISGYTRIAPAQIQPAWVLKEAPLSFDDAQLGFLALSLRGYVQHYKPKETVYAAETRKKDQTVKSLATLIYGKVK